MRDLTDPHWIHAKGGLFLLAGLMASAGILFDHPDARTAFLLVVGVICFCRFYYYAFYVIEHYVDDTYRFAGLWAFVRYLWRRRR